MAKVEVRNTTFAMWVVASLAPLLVAAFVAFRFQDGFLGNLWPLYVVPVLGLQAGLWFAWVWDRFRRPAPEGARGMPPWGPPQFAVILAAAFDAALYFFAGPSAFVADDGSLGIGILGLLFFQVMAVGAGIGGSVLKEARTASASVADRRVQWRAFAAGFLLLAAIGVAAAVMPGGKDGGSVSAVVLQGERWTALDSKAVSGTLVYDPTTRPYGVGPSSTAQFVLPAKANVLNVTGTVQGASGLVPRGQVTVEQEAEGQWQELGHFETGTGWHSIEGGVGPGAIRFQVEVEAFVGDIEYDIGFEAANHVEWNCAQHYIDGVPQDKGCPP